MTETTARRAPWDPRPPGWKAGHFRRIFWPVLAALLPWTVIMLICAYLLTSYVAGQVSDSINDTFSTPSEPTATAAATLSADCIYALDVGADTSLARMFDDQELIDAYQPPENSK